MSIILRAARVAEYAHRGQYRRHPDSDGALAPYIVHPERVAALITRHANDAELFCDTSSDWEQTPEHLVAAAWLHDVLEDTQVDAFYLSFMFPRRVVRLVEGMTRRKGSRWEDYAERFRYGEPALVTLKAADVADNLADSMHAPEGFRRHYAKKAENYLRVLSDASEGVPADLLEIATDRLDRLKATIPG